jgi:hypothetical protein
VNSGPSPCTGRGPRIGRRKTSLTCGAPLRNRTVDLLLTMYRSAVPQPQVGQLTCADTSTRWHSRAPDEPTRAPFATQSATHFDLADEPDEVVDIRFDDPAIRVHGRSPRFTSTNRLRSARGAVQGCTSNATQTVLDQRTQDRTAALALEIDDPGAGRWEALRRDLVDSNTDFA